MRSRARALAALMVVGAVSSLGVVAAPASGAAVPAPSGGCWTYVPSGAGLNAPPSSDVSTTLGTWTTVADGGFVLETGGDTRVGGTRSVRVAIASGPVVATTAVTGTASFLLSLDGEPLDEPLTAPFSAAAGAPVTGLEASVELPALAAGTHRVRLDAVYFDAPTASRRVVCNGQTSGAPGGANPATSPEPTDLTEPFGIVASASATVTAIDDQAVLDRARPGEDVTVRLVGLASSVPVSLELCAADAACAPVSSGTTEPDGSLTTTFMMPASAPIGAGTLRVKDGSTTVSTPLGALGVQLVAAAEELTAETTVVTLTGTGWDPTRPVTVQGYAGTDSSTPTTSDEVLDVEVDAVGEFTATYEVAAEDTESVIVDQARTGSHIGAVYLISGVIGGAAAPEDPKGPDDPQDPTGNDDPPGAETPAAPQAPGGVVTTPLTPDTTVEPPADIPIPGEVPIGEPGAVPPAGEQPVADLAVSEARLDGHATLGEWFGGSPRRELIFLVENVGDEVVSSPPVRVSVGRSDVEPQLVAADVGDLEPGDRAVVTVPLELPMAAFGEYRVIGQVGDTELGGFKLDWTTYPWGLFVLNALALGLLAWGLQRRFGRRRTPTAAMAAPADGDAVVDLDAADTWWAYRSGTGPRPGAQLVSSDRPAPVVEDLGAGDAIVDLDAAEDWWSRSARSPRRVS